jgi:MFS transporter, DHA1 family, multidrug resistance protein
LSWKRTLAILWIANFCVMAGMSLVIPFLPLYIEQLGIHSLSDVERWSGWVFSIQFVTSFIFQPIWGAFADKHGRKVMLLRAGFGMGVVTTLMGIVGAAWQLLALRFINGFFSGFISMSVSLQASVTPGKDAGRALGILQTGGIAGSLIGPLIGGALAEAVGFRSVFYLTGAMLLIASIVVLVFVKEDRAKLKIGEERQKVGLRDLRPLYIVFAASFITQAGMMSIEPIVTVFTKTIYHGAHLETIAGLVVATTGIANLIGSPLLGRFGDTIGQKKILTLALVCASLAFIPQALAETIGVLLVGRFLLGLFIGGMVPSLNVLVKKIAPYRIQATAFGFNSSALFLGNLVGPLIGGSVAASFGIRSVFYVTMVILLMNAVLVAFSRQLTVPEQAAEV